MIIQDLVNILDDAFPPSLQEKYDNTGCQVLFPEDRINSILLSLDIDSSVIDEALEKGCNMIITHHPVFFRPIKRLCSGEQRSDMVIRLLMNRINVYSAHTNLDKIYNDRLSRALGLKSVNVLFETDSLNNGVTTGFGVMAETEGPVTLKSLMDTVKERLSLEYIIYSGSEDSVIRSVAVMNGAGGGQVEKIISENPGVDCIITGDVGYHSAHFASDNGVSVIDAGHYGTERVLLGYLKMEIMEFLADTEPSDVIGVHVSGSEKNPFRVY